MLYDKDIREPLFDFLDGIYPVNRIIEEQYMGRSRADLVLVTPLFICGIEIKSDADSYTRLKTQVRDYDRFFDYNYIVSGTSHAAHVKEHVPKHWGIITVEQEEGRTDFYIMRQPSPNPEVTWNDKLKLMWRPEMADMQEKLGLPAYKYLSKSDLIEKLIEKVPEDDLQKYFCYELMERDYTRISEQINDYRKSHGRRKRRKPIKRRRD